LSRWIAHIDRTPRWLTEADAKLKIVCAWPVVVTSVRLG